MAADNALLFQEQVEIRTRVQQLAAERALVLGQIADSVLIADAAGRVTFANGVAQQLHGDLALALPLPLSDYVRRYRVRTAAGFPLAPEALPLQQALVTGETVVNESWRLRRPDSQDLIVEGSAAPLLADDGRRLGAVQTLQDITAR